MDTYPFQLQDDMVARLPPPARDGYHHVDVKVSGKWEGILVVDSSGICSGVYVRRHTEEWPLPFEAAEIQDLRPACLRNRLLAQIPFDLWDCALLTVFIASPIFLVLAHILLPALALLPVIGSAIAIYLMYQSPGFPFIRLLAATLGLAEIIFGAMLLIAWINILLTQGVQQAAAPDGRLAALSGVHYYKQKKPDQSD